MIGIFKRLDNAYSWQTKRRSSEWFSQGGATLVGVDVCARAGGKAVLCTICVAALRSTLNYALWMRNYSDHTAYYQVIPINYLPWVFFFPRFYCHPVCYRLNVCVPLQSVHWNPNPQCDHMRTLGQIRLKEWSPPEWDFCPYVKGSLSFPPCEDTAKNKQTNKTKKQANCEQEVCSHLTLNLPVSWTWASQPPERLEINLCCL